MTRNSMKAYPIRSHLLWLIVLACVIGCAGPMKRITGKKSKYRLSVGVVFFKNPLGPGGDELQDEYRTHFIAALKQRCTGYRLLLPGDPGYPVRFIKQPTVPAATIDNLRLARTGRDLGLNAVVVTRIVDVSTEKARRGYLWFARRGVDLQLTAFAEVYETLTGAKIDDKSLTRKFPASKRPARPGGAASPALGREKVFTAVAELGRAAGRIACKSMKTVPWNAYIVDVKADRIILSSGHNAGLSVGDTLDVYDAADVVEGKGQERFFLPGEKTGTIEIIEVGPDTAVGISILNRGIRPGAAVRP